MRVLAVHGGGGNSNIMRGMTSMLQRMLGKEAEWDFLEGDTEYNNEGAVSWGAADFTMNGVVIKPSEMDVALARGVPLKGWWVSKCDDADDKRHWLERLNDTSVSYTYSNQAEAHAEKLLRHIEIKGPFDALVTFSQASALVLLALGLLRERGLEPSWRLSVFFSPMPVRDKRFHRLFLEPLDHPVVLCISPIDWAFESAKEFRLHEWFTQTVLLEHHEGHKLPSQIAQAREFYAQLVTEMWSHCGAELWQVVGGASKGGIVVRTGRELSSDKEEQRLCTGALLLQLELQGERLRFRSLVSPKAGPASGWVSLACEGKALVAKATRPQRLQPPACAPLAAPPWAAKAAEPPPEGALGA